MTSILEFNARFPDEDACLAYLFEQRYGAQPPCPKCGRPAKWYRIRSVRGYSTNCCSGRSLPLQGGTLFHGTRLPLRTWFYAMLLFANSRSGVRRTFLAEHLGIGVNAAVRMATCIRTHMTLLDQARVLGGSGRPVRIATTLLRGVRTDAVRGAGRIRLIGLADDDIAHALPYASRQRPQLWLAITALIRAGSVLVVEEPSLYAWLANKAAGPVASAALTVRFEPSISAADPLDGFYLVLKRWLRSTHLHVRREHVARFIGEFTFRYNRRSDPQGVFDAMMAAFPPIPLPTRSDHRRQS